MYRVDLITRFYQVLKQRFSYEHVTRQQKLSVSLVQFLIARFIDQRWQKLACPASLLLTVGFN